MKNIAVFASGNGTNFQAIAEAIKKRRLRVNLRLLVCDEPNAFCLERAKKFKVQAKVIRRQDYPSRKEFEVEIIKNLESARIDLVVLAGFMRLLSPWFVRRYKNKIINIHPALLPSFKGTQGIKDAYIYGVKITGVTVHFVDTDIDHGPIILQEAVKIKDSDTLLALENKIHAVEHKIYPKAIQLFASGKLKIKGRKVVFILPTHSPGLEKFYHH